MSCELLLKAATAYISCCRPVFSPSCRHCWPVVFRPTFHFSWLFFALRVIARTTETSLTSTSIVLSSANFTSASARLTSVWTIWIPGRQRRYHHARELAVWRYRTVTLHLRNVGVRRTAVLLSQLYSTDEKVLLFWRGELSATELQLSCWYELRRQVTYWCDVTNSH